MEDWPYVERELLLWTLSDSPCRGPSTSPSCFILNKPDLDVPAVLTRNLFHITQKVQDEDSKKTKKLQIPQTYLAR